VEMRGPPSLMPPRRDSLPPFVSGREKLLALAASLALGSLSTFEYVKVSYEKCFAEFPAWHQAHISNQAVAPLQYRVLSYLIPELLSRTGLPIGVSYILERGLFHVAAGYVFFLFCRTWLGTIDTLFATTLLMFFCTLSAFPHIQPSEEINLFAFALGLLFIRRDRFWLLLATVAVAAFNKETIGFLIPFYFLWERRRSGASGALLARTAALLGVLAVAYVGIRIHFGVNRPYLGGLWQLRHNLTIVVTDPFLGLVFLLPSLGPAAWIFLRRRGALDPFFVAFLPSLCLFVAGHVAISRVEEFRTYGPLALMTIPASMLLLRESLANWSPIPAPSPTRR
jgi:hypothetical protein